MQHLFALLVWKFFKNSEIPEWLNPVLVFWFTNLFLKLIFQKIWPLCNYEVVALFFKNKFSQKCHPILISILLKLTKNGINIHMKSQTIAIFILWIVLKIWKNIYKMLMSLSLHYHLEVSQNACWQAL